MMAYAPGAMRSSQSTRRQNLEMRQANATPAAATIRSFCLPALSITIVGVLEDEAPTGDLDITRSVTIQGAGITCDAGGALYADGGAFHGYIAQTGIKPYPMPEEDSTSGCIKFMGCAGSIVTKTTLMRQVFDEHGLAGKPMFDTEGSWGEGNVTDQDTQAAWLARWYLLQAGLRSTNNLQIVAWFTWGRPKTFLWGMIENDSFAPTLAGIAFNQVVSWLVGTTINQPCSSTSDGIWTCSLSRPGGYGALAIWNMQDSKSYVPSNAYTVYRDLAGKTVKITKGNPITIGAKPILLETAVPTSSSP
jgi:hypothetical protein